MAKAEIKHVHGTLDDAISAAQDWANQGKHRVGIQSAATGKLEGVVEPMSENTSKSFGTSEVWDKAWTDFKARQAAAASANGKKRKCDD